MKQLGVPRVWGKDFIQGGRYHTEASTDISGESPGSDGPISLWDALTSAATPQSLEEPREEGSLKERFHGGCSSMGGEKL